MKKLSFVSAVLMAAALVISCSSSKEVTSAAVQAEKDGVPAWVYEGKRDSTGIYAVGAGKLSTLQNSLKMARSQARIELANMVKVNVETVTQTLVDDQGSDTDRQNLQAFTEHALLRTDAVLQGSEQVDFFQDNDKSVYVLMYLPYSTLVTELNKELEEQKPFSRNSTAAYTEAKMAEAYEKYFASNTSE